MLLDIDTVFGAAKLLLIQSILDEVDDKDAELQLPPGLEGVDAYTQAGSLAEQIIQREQSTIGFILGRYLGQLEEKWGYNPGLVFYHGALSREQKVRAVYLFVMNLWGHGVGLEDEFHAQLERAADILSKGHPKDFGQLARQLSADQHETWTCVLFVDKYLVPKGTKELPAAPDMRRARAAYEAYGRATNFKNFRGDLMPRFEDLGKKIQTAWIAACDGTLQYWLEHEFKPAVNDDALLTAQATTLLKIGHEKGDSPTKCVRVAIASFVAHLIAPNKFSPL